MREILFRAKRKNNGETGRKHTEYRKSAVHNLYAGRDLHTG